MHNDNAEAVTAAVQKVDTITKKIDAAKSELFVISSDFKDYLRTSSKRLDELKSDAEIRTDFYFDQLRKYPEDYSNTYNNIYQRKCQNLETDISNNLDVPDWSDRKE